MGLWDPARGTVSTVFFLGPYSPSRGRRTIAAQWYKRAELRYGGDPLDRNCLPILHLFLQLLVKLALNGTEAGRTHAAQALAKIGATINPEIAFPGQRMYEIVKPMVGLLHYDRSGLQNYEALLTLTNLASMSDSVR